MTEKNGGGGKGIRLDREISKDLQGETTFLVSLEVWIGVSQTKCVGKKYSRKRDKHT